MREILVELWQSPGAFLVIEKPTNVFYTNQVGGICCMHPKVEGFLVPLDRYMGNLDTLAELTEDYWPELPVDPKELKGLVSQLTPTSNDQDWHLEPDINRINDKNYPCGEAWIPVKVLYNKQELKGWLTWENSD